MANNNRSLISILKDLYSQLSQISWGITQFRLNSYKRNVKPAANITSLLHKQIEGLSSQSKAEKTNLANEANKASAEVENKNKGSTAIHKDAKVENVTGVQSEFVKYVKQRRPVNVTQPHVGEDLKASVWKHIHAAKRYAKSGNLEAARLHVDIAGSALEEAGDYMSNEDYTDLVLQVEGYFTEAH